MNTSCAFPKAVSDDHYWSTQVNCVQTVVPSSAISSDAAGSYHSCRSAVIGLTRAARRAG